MNINRNKELSQLFVLWNTYKNRNKINWNDFVSLFFNKQYQQYSFIKKLDKFVSRDELKSFLNEANKIETLWNNYEIKSIIIDDFKLFKAFDYLKNSLFFFYLGDLSILKNSINEIVSVIGSRTTPQKYINWIKENVPKDKIVVSGLAKGADSFAHLNSIELNNKIIAIPGVDIFSYQSFDNNQKIILEYAKNNGLILTNIVPFTKVYSKDNYLKRNKWMAQISSETYVTYFKEISGSLSQLYETAKLKRNIYMPKDVYEINKEFLINHKYFNIVLNSLNVLNSKSQNFANKELEK